MFDEVEDVRSMLDGLGDAVSDMPNTKISSKSGAELHSVSACVDSASLTSMTRAHSSQNLSREWARKSSKVSWVSDLYPPSDDNCRYPTEGRSSTTSSGTNLDRNWSLTTGDIPLLVESLSSRSTILDQFSTKSNTPEINNISIINDKEDNFNSNQKYVEINSSQPNVRQSLFFCIYCHGRDIAFNLFLNSFSIKRTMALGAQNLSKE